MTTLPHRFRWEGRSDVEDGSLARRWHHCVSSVADIAQINDFAGCPVFVGFACDEGVRRNHGRVGAKAGPDRIRAAMANLAAPRDFRFFDVGNIVCEDGDLESAQQILADTLTVLLGKNARPFILGGGHEVAWGSYLGGQQYIAGLRQGIRETSGSRLGIINFDAHFDLRTPVNGASSGTPFYQCCEYVRQKQQPFDYFVLGLNLSANTEALFTYAMDHGVRWLSDIETMQHSLGEIESQLAEFIQPLDYLYLTTCLDVFSVAFAPGVSAPAALGIEPQRVIMLYSLILRLCRLYSTPLLMCDIAEMNPNFDRDAQTAKLAARLVYQLITEEISS